MAKQKSKEIAPKLTLHSFFKPVTNPSSTSTLRETSPKLSSTKQDVPQVATMSVDNPLSLADNGGFEDTINDEKHKYAFEPLPGLEDIVEEYRDVFEGSPAQYFGKLTTIKAPSSIPRDMARANVLKDRPPPVLVGEIPEYWEFESDPVERARIKERFRSKARKAKARLERIEAQRQAEATRPAKDDDVGVNNPNLNIASEQVATGMTGPTGPIVPFLPPPNGDHICPFKALGRCVSKTASYNNFRFMALHTHQAYKGELIQTLEQNPFEDGTSKIPCKDGCVHKSAVTMRQVIMPVDVHGMSRSCFLGLVHGTPFLGSFALSGGYYCDMYLLAGHLEVCNSANKPQLGFVLSRIEIRVEATELQSYSLLVVASSSSQAPKSWLGGHEYVDQGLPAYAQGKINTFKESIGFGNADAIFHAGTHVQTRYIPTSRHDNAYHFVDTYHRSAMRRAWKFIMAIEKDLRAQAEANPQLKPILLSMVSMAESTISMGYSRNRTGLWDDGGTLPKGFDWSILWDLRVVPDSNVSRDWLGHGISVGLDGFACYEDRAL
ncbi:hypothetical protein P153DRAFT_400136 [Dothidotthia symphoricarpi CBS 119687]|uniref:Uncharacterized protein n=1 Tax=Dothidotthia symphoricarpi CBS 119687 TaxID=1392245 RepID=A0A6A6A328_9PLEO|nr:uncharacterized protein P153DRAFT_400136 [Dothidotthia symphoricarpi CBS 119687]KAF2125307.1 hypothetical protein P153DRAFT_400136 [Dothidotthia symphoricarpi CBS 119687]